MTASWTQKNNNRICPASRALRRLRDRVFQKHNLPIQTNIKVYTATSLSTPYYGSKTWTVYARHLRLLEAWHIKSLRFNLGVTLRDKLTYEEIYRKTYSASLVSQLGSWQLKWIGNVKKKDDNRLPKLVLYTEFSTGERKTGGQKKRHKNQIKYVLKKFKVATEMLPTLQTVVSGARSATKTP